MFFLAPKAQQTIGEVNFYWEDQGKKYAREMNTGNSCHITPYAPHSFTSRNPEQPGLIIAVTYGDQIRRANNHLALDAQSQPSYLKDVLSTYAAQREIHSPFNLALRLHFDADLLTHEQLAQRLQALLSSAKSTILEIRSDSKQRLQQHAYHQYVYNYSDQTVLLTLQDNQLAQINQTGRQQLLGKTSQWF